MRLCRAVGPLLAVLILAGCEDFFAGLRAYTVRGSMAADLVPADREVGSWRRESGRAGEVVTLRTRRFKEDFGAEAAARARPWGLGESVMASYRLGNTGRSVTVEIWDLNRPLAAFDVYSFIREKSLAGAAPAARTTKVGAQGMISIMKFGGMQGDGPFAEKFLLFWTERFLVFVTHRVTPGSDDLDGSAESALLAFGNAIAAKTKRPFELPEVLALQVVGEKPDSERYEPGRLFGRRELADGFTARWTGQTGSGTLFLHVAGSDDDAASEFRRLRAAAGGVLAPECADGLFVGNLPSVGPVVCVRKGAVLAGLVGAAEAAERRDTASELVRRLAGEPRLPEPADETEAAP